MRDMAVGDMGVGDMDVGDLDVGDVDVGDMDVGDMDVGDLGVEDASTLPEGTLDPNEVHLHGFRVEGMCDTDAIEDFRGGTPPLDGFGCSGRWPGIIRPTDGRVIYIDTDGDNTLHVFRPESSDLIVSTPECTSVSDFRIEPDSGDILYHCGSCAVTVDCDNVVYRDSGGTYPLAPPILSAVRGWLPGYNGIALRYTATAVLLESASGVVAVDTDLSVFDENSYEIRTVRAIPEGFRVVTVEESHVFSSFIVARDGTVTLEGDYPPWTDTFGYPGNCQLALDGAMVCQTYRVGASADVVLRFELGAPDLIVVLDEGNNPAVRPAGGGLFTGP